VASETSGASRNDLETVITETPASTAMSLSRTIAIKNSKRKMKTARGQGVIVDFQFCNFHFKDWLRANEA
jgi:hypothetical protein